MYLPPTSVLLLMRGRRFKEYDDPNGKGMVKAPSPGKDPMNRPHDTELSVDAHVAQWAVQTIVRALSIYAIVIGITILIGGSARFSSTSYEIARHAPGAPESWGAWALTSGMIAFAGTLAARPVVVFIGALLAALWCLLFASAFALAAYQIDEANTTGMWSYLALAVVFLVLAGVHYAMKPFARHWLKRKATTSDTERTSPREA